MLNLYSVFDNRNSVDFIFGYNILNTIKPNTQQSKYPYNYSENKNLTFTKNTIELLIKETEELEYNSKINIKSPKAKSPKAKSPKVKSPKAKSTKSPKVKSPKSIKGSAQPLIYIYH